MGRLSTFVAPLPSSSVIQLMSFVNRAVIVGGIPLLKYVWGFRPLTRITEVDFPEADQATLRTLVDVNNTAVFITPNHPEFFTDWMLDKYVLSKVAPQAASWATHTIVNGTGALLQRFWLANNLIAQIPQATESARQHSINWAAQGYAVLLHPEGNVGWHANYIAPVFSGAAQMALDTLLLHRKVTESFVAPVVWKIVFTKDVTKGLRKEYYFICKQFSLEPQSEIDPAKAVYHLYEEVLARSEATLFGVVDRAEPFRFRVIRLLVQLENELRDETVSTETGAILTKTARDMIKLFQVSDTAKAKCLTTLIQEIERWQRLSAFAWTTSTITQEEIAEHQKRLRSFYCVRGFSNIINRFVPRAVGPRRVCIRVLQPIALHTESGLREVIVREATARLQAGLQRGVDTLSRTIPSANRPVYINPFF